MLAILALGSWFGTPTAPEVLDLERTQNWRVELFTEDADLSRVAVFDIAFEETEADDNGGYKIETWIAASNGLHHYDGWDWTRYTHDDGLPSDYVRSVTVHSDGTLWVGTDKGAGVFTTRGYEPRSPSRGDDPLTVRRIVEAPDGAIWLCCDQWPNPRIKGGLFRWDGDTWTEFGESDGLPATYVSDVFFAPNGEQFVMTRNGIVQWTGSGFEMPPGLEQVIEPLAYVWSICEDLEGRLHLTTDNQHLIRRDGVWEAHGWETENKSHPVLIVTQDGILMSADTSVGRLQFSSIEDGGQSPLTGPIAKSQDTGIERLIEAPDGAVWALAQGLVARWERLGSEWIVHGELPEVRMRDRAGTVWFAGPDRVLSKPAGASELVPGMPGTRAPIAEGANGHVFCSMSDGVVVLGGEEPKIHTFASMGLTDGALIVNPDQVATPWVFGSSLESQYVAASYEDGQWTTVSFEYDEELAELSAGYAAPNGSLYFTKTLNEDGTHLLLKLNAGEAEWIEMHAKTAVLAPPSLYMDRRNRLWVYGFTGLFLELLKEGEEGEWVHYFDAPGQHAITCFESGDSTWFGFRSTTGGSEGWIAVGPTGDYEVVEQPVYPYVGTAGNQRLFFRTPQGLMWMSPRGGPSDTGHLSMPIDEDVQWVVPDSDGLLWIQTRRGPCSFRPDGIAPETRVGALALNGQGKMATARIEVEGIEWLRPRGHFASLQVAYRVDSGSWGPFRTLTGALETAELGIGASIIEVTTRDESGEVDETPAQIPVYVPPVPLQDRDWFPLAVGALFALIAGLAGVNFAARRKLGAQAEGLEGTVRSRTAELQLTLQKQQHLMLELDHRVKNTLATVQAVCEQTLAKSQSPKLFARAFRGRLASLGAVHETLAREHWEGAGIRELVARTLAPYDDGERLRIEGDDTVLDVRVATPMAMALHELATNAAKYGSLSVPEGRLSVSWVRTGQKVELNWVESGGPTPTPPAERGFGSQLIEEGLAYEAGADVDLTFEPTGVHCRIALSLSESGSRPV